MIFVLWDLTIRLFRIPPYLIPTPLAVAKMLVEEWPRLWRESLVTAYATLGGFGLSILFGIPIAMLIAYSRMVESFVYPLLVFSQSIPEDRDRAAVRRLVRLRHHPQGDLGLSARLFSRRRRYRDGLQVGRARDDRSRALDARVALADVHQVQPAAGAAASIFSGLKVSATLAVVGAVVGEFVGSNSGIGYVLQIANGNFDLPLMFAALVVLSMMGVLLFVAVDARREADDSVASVAPRRSHRRHRVNSVAALLRKEETRC